MSTGLTNVVLVFGGLGLFLFGMRIMSNGLQTVAGDKLHSVLQKATSNRFLGVTVGIIATIALNSSTATTVMTVSFVNSGLMNLTQAIGIILGANVGTTLSAQLVAFRIDSFAPAFIFVGVVMYVFFKKKSVKNIGYIILGFGILFFGITTMGGPLRGLTNVPGFNEALVAFQNPILAILAGFVFTTLVQSSTAATGVLVAMYLSGVPIPFSTGAFIILGTNIGTSTTAMIASIPANRESKRAALFHISFDILGSIVFGTLIFFIPAILAWFEATWAEPARQIAMFHTLYNFATMFLILPFTKQAAMLMEKIIPEKKGEADATYERKLLYLDAKMQQSPATAVFNAHMELCRMAKIANDTLRLALNTFLTKDVGKTKKVFENEGIINYLNHQIASKLVWISKMRLSGLEAERIGKMFRILTDIERIGDHAENISEFAIMVEEEGLKLSETAYDELRVLGDATLELADLALTTYEHDTRTNLDRVRILEDKVDQLCHEFTENHLKRLTEGTCDLKGGVVFTDMINDLERSGDHANNIAFSISMRRKERD